MVSLATWLKIVSLYGFDVGKAEKVFNNPERRDRIQEYLNEKARVSELEKAFETPDVAWNEETRHALGTVDGAVIKALIEADLEDNGFELVRTIICRDARIGYNDPDELKMVIFIAEKLMHNQLLASDVKKALAALRELSYHIYHASNLFP